MSQNRSLLSPTEHVIAQVNELGLVKAAPALGVSPAKLCRWMKEQGYVRKTLYVKEVKNTTTLQPA